jgi:hypothetical protein
MISHELLRYLSKHGSFQKGYLTNVQAREFTAQLPCTSSWSFKA